MKPNVKLISFPEADDIAACGYDRTVKIANNLPEVMETIHLARDAAAALETTPVAETPTWLADPDFDFHGQWLHQFPKEIKARPSIPRYLRKGNFDKHGMAVSIADRKDGLDVTVHWNCYRAPQFRGQVDDDEDRASDDDEEYREDDDEGGDQEDEVEARTRWWISRVQGSK